MNKEQKLQLVTFEQAKKLKEAGFDWHSIYFYLWNENISKQGIVSMNYNSSFDERGNPYYSAPTASLALKWFRDVKGVTASIVRYNDDGVIKWVGSYNEPKLKYTDMFDTYELAESELLDELLALIESK
jgi:hypothetical protein